MCVCTTPLLFPELVKPEMNRNACDAVIHCPMSLSSQHLKRAQTGWMDVLNWLCKLKGAN